VVQIPAIASDSGIIFIFSSIVAERIFGHLPNAGLMLVKSGKQAGTGWAASGSIVKLAKPNSLLCEFVEIGSWYFAAKTPDVGKAHIVGHDQDNVWLLSECHAASQGCPEC
jgi:hypothetical protein